MIQERLASHLLEPQTWIARANGNIHVARFYQEQIEPVGSFQAKDYTDSFWGRLMLLNQAEWELLGFAVSLAPMLGKISKSIDGRFKKAVKARFDDMTISHFDAIPTSLSTEALLLLPTNCWLSPETVILGGIHTIKAMGNFTPSQHKILAERFSEGEPSVSNIQPSLVEVLCKISLPSQPWLFADTPSVSLQDA